MEAVDEHASHKTKTDWLMRIHHIAIWLSVWKKWKNSISVTSKVQAIRNTSTLKKGLNPTLSASTAEPTWSWWAVPMYRILPSGKTGSVWPLRLCTRQQRRGSRTDGKAAKCRIYHQRRTPYIGRRIFWKRSARPRRQPCGMRVQGRLKSHFTQNLNQRLSSGIALSFLCLQHNS